MSRAALLVATGMLGCFVWAVLTVTKVTGMEPHFSCGSVVSPEPVSSSSVSVLVETPDPLLFAGPFEAECADRVHHVQRWL